MSTEAWVVILGAPPVFALGWFGRGFYDTMKETRMAPTKRRRFRPIDALFAWFSHGNRLVGLALSCALLAGSALGYTFTADQQSEGRSDDIVTCVAKYVREAGKQQAPRTVASVKMTKARFEYDMGRSVEHPELTKKQLRERYQRAFADYQLSVAVNPTLPTFSLEFCEGVS